MLPPADDERLRPRLESLCFCASMISQRISHLQKKVERRCTVSCWENEAKINRGNVTGPGRDKSTTTPNFQSVAVGERGKEREKERETFICGAKTNGEIHRRNAENARMSWCGNSAYTNSMLHSGRSNIFQSVLPS